MAPSLSLQNPWHRIAFAAIIIAYPIFNGTVLGALPFVRPLFDPPPGNHSYWLTFWGIVVAYQWIVFAIVMISIARSGLGRAGIGVEAPTKVGATVVATVALAITAWLIAVSVKSGPASTGDPFMPRGLSEYLLWLLVMSPTAAICEETAYRGFLFTYFRGAIGITVGVILQALIFGYHHGGIFQGLMSFAYRFVMGLVLQMIVLWRGNLRLAMAMHFLYDASYALP